MVDRSPLFRRPFTETLKRLLGTMGCCFKKGSVGVHLGPIGFGSLGLEGINPVAFVNSVPLRE